MVHAAKQAKTDFYIEVTDRNVVASTEEQKKAVPAAEEVFDSISILVDADRAGYKALAENNEYWLADAVEGDAGVTVGKPRWESKQYFNRIDATGYAAAHWWNGDYFGETAVTSGVFGDLYYEKTETGYILEFSLRGISYGSTIENGIAIVLTDADGEGQCYPLHA